MSPTTARWFACIGQPLAGPERAEIEGMLREHAVFPAAQIVAAAGWWDAASVLQAGERDPRAWDLEEEERERLWTLAAERHGEQDLLERLRAVTDALAEAVHEAAVGAAARHGVGDAGLIREAAGAALLSAHQNALADLAGAAPDHWFRRKHALFVRGRWPLGFSGDRFVVF